MGEKAVGGDESVAPSSEGEGGGTGGTVAAATATPASLAAMQQNYLQLLQQMTQLQQQLPTGKPMEPSVLHPAMMLLLAKWTIYIMISWGE